MKWCRRRKPQWQPEAGLVSFPVYVLVVGERIEVFRHENLAMQAAERTGGRLVVAPMRWL